MDDEDDEDDWGSFLAGEVDRKLAAIANPVRRYLLELLVFGGSSAGSLALSAATRFGISSSRGSQHLQVLARAELVHVGVDGPRRDYVINERGFVEVTEWLAGLRLESEAGR